MKDEMKHMPDAVRTRRAYDGSRHGDEGRQPGRELPMIGSWWAGAMIAVAVIFTGLSALGQSVPQLISYQGRVSVGGTLFSGTGQFSFALVSPGGTTSYWSNDGTSVSGSQPATALSLPVSQGLYTVLLGDTNIAGMTAIPMTVFSNTDVRLRIWFNDGAHGFQQLAPDQRIASVGYAMVSGSAAVAGQDACAAQCQVTSIGPIGTNFNGTVLAPLNIIYANGPSNLNATTGTFTAGRSGAYLVSEHLLCTGPATFTAGEQVFIGVEGAAGNSYTNLCSQAFSMTQSGAIGFNGTALVPMNAGDQFQIVAGISNAGNGASNPLPVTADGRFSQISFVWVGN